MEDWLRSAEILNKSLGLSPYESRAYLSLLTYGPMTPSELARKSDIPRPRAYDVLTSLTQKGLLMEQSGRPSIYAPVEPAHGLEILVVGIEMETLGQLKEKRQAAQRLSKLFSRTYDKSRHLRLERSKVWFTRRDKAFIAIYVEAIKNCKKEFLVASTDLRPPEKEILRAIKYAVKNGRSARVVRQITDSWTLKELERYEEVIKAGSQVRYLNVEEILLRFMIFDEKDVIIVLPDEPGSTMHEALWLRIPSLAKILRWHFEELWEKGEQMLPILGKIKVKKT